MIGIGQGDKPTLLSTIDVRRGRPLVQDEAHFQLDGDSALGAFYDVTDSPALRPLFEDAEHMQVVYHRALEERVVTMEVDGRVAAVVFLCPDGSGLYATYAGFDKDMRAVAVLVDLKILDDGDWLTLQAVSRVGSAQRLRGFPRRAWIWSTARLIRCWFAGLRASSYTFLAMPSTATFFRMPMTARYPAAHAPAAHAPAGSGHRT